MTEPVITLNGVGKMYRLYQKPGAKVLDALGLGFLSWRHRNLYREFWALRDINLRIQRGERIGIIGRNGAGKSTLLKVLCGNLAPTEGEVQIRGSVQALMELGTGFHPEFNGRENIRASLAYHGLSDEEIRRKEEEIVEFAELEEFIDQPVRTYSAGMYARLAFSTATAIEPEILIIDEILGAGDAYFAGKCLERMQRLTEEAGATVLFVSHDLAGVQQLCPRVIWIERGRLHRQGPALEVIKEYQAVVRAEQETRLRARDMRVLKKQAAQLDADADVYQKLLFHLVSLPSSRPAGKQKERLRVYRVALLLGGQTLAEIDVGSPMDNAASWRNYVMDGDGYMDWGKPARDETGTYRSFGDFGGRYAHAPFELALPRSAATGRGELTLEMSCRIPENGGAAVEIYDGTRYHRLGVLEFSSADTKDVACYRWVIPWAVLPGAEPEKESEAAPAEADTPTVSEYGDGKMEILAIRLLNEAGEETRIFQTHQPMEVELDVFASQPADNPVFVFCIYLPDGRCASQWIVSSESLGIPRMEGRGTVRFRVDRLLLGRSAYVASAAIFKYLRRDGAESEAFHVLDRCLHFQVLQPMEDTVERGLCLQPFQAEWIA